MPQRRRLRLRMSTPARSSVIVSTSTVNASTPIQPLIFRPHTSQRVSGRSARLSHPIFFPAAIPSAPPRRRTVSTKSIPQITRPQSRHVNSRVDHSRSPVLSDEKYRGASDCCGAGLRVGRPTGLLPGAGACCDFCTRRRVFSISRLCIMAL